MAGSSWDKYLDDLRSGRERPTFRAVPKKTTFEAKPFASDRKPGMSDADLRDSFGPVESTAGYDFSEVEKEPGFVGQVGKTFLQLLNLPTNVIYTGVRAGLGAAGAIEDDTRSSWEVLKSAWDEGEGFTSLINKDLLDLDEDASFLVKAPGAFLGFIGDVALDPTTYLSSGGSILGRGALKGVSASFAKSSVDDLAARGLDDVIRNAGRERASRELGFDVATMSDDEVLEAISTKQRNLLGEEARTTIDDAGRRVIFEEGGEAAEVVYKSADEMYTDFARRSIEEAAYGARVAGTGSTFAKTMDEVLTRWNADVDTITDLVGKADYELVGGLSWKLPFAERIRLSKGGVNALSNSGFSAMGGAIEAINLARLKVRAGIAPQLARMRGAGGAEYASILQQIKKGTASGSDLASFAAKAENFGVFQQAFLVDAVRSQEAKFLRVVAEAGETFRAGINDERKGFRGVALSRGVDEAEYLADEQWILGYAGRRQQDYDLTEGFTNPKANVDAVRVGKAIEDNKRFLELRAKYGEEQVDSMVKKMQDLEDFKVSVLGEAGVKGASSAFENRVVTADTIAWYRRGGHRNFGQSSPTTQRQRFNRTVEETGVASDEMLREAFEEDVFQELVNLAAVRKINDEKFIAVERRIAELKKVLDDAQASGQSLKTLSKESEEINRLRTQRKLILKQARENAKDVNEGALSIEEVNALMREEYGIDFDFFETDAVRRAITVTDRAAVTAAKKKGMREFVKSTGRLYENPEVFKNASDLEIATARQRFEDYISVTGLEVTQDVLEVIAQQVRGVQELVDTINRWTEGPDGFFIQSSSGAALSEFVPEDAETFRRRLGALIAGDSKEFNALTYSDSSITSDLMRSKGIDLEDLESIPESVRINLAAEAAGTYAVRVADEWRALADEWAAAARQGLGEAGDEFAENISADFIRVATLMTKSIDEMGMDALSVRNIGRTIIDNTITKPSRRAELIGMARSRNPGDIDGLVRLLESEQMRLLQESSPVISDDAFRARREQELLGQLQRKEITAKDYNDGLVALRSTDVDTELTELDFAIRDLRTIEENLRGKQFVLDVQSSKSLSAELPDNVELPMSLRARDRGAYFGDEGIRETMVNLFTASTPKGFDNAFTPYHDMVLTMFKTYATVGQFGIGFHLRNFMGGMSNNIAGGVVAKHVKRGNELGGVATRVLNELREEGQTDVLKFSEAVEDRAFKVLSETEDEITARAGAKAIRGAYDEGVFQSQTVHLLEENAAASGAYLTPGGKPDYELMAYEDVRRRMATGDARSTKKYEEMKKYFDAREHAARNPDDKAAQAALARNKQFAPSKGEIGQMRLRYGKVTNNKYVEAQSKIGQHAEHRLRMAAYLQGVERFGSSEGGSLFAKALHFDYQDLTDFEKNVLKRVLPFYVWMRRNLPLQARLIMNRPGRWDNLQDLKDAMQETFGDPGVDEGLLPDYLQQKMGFFAKVPGVNNLTGKAVLRMETPALDLFEWVSPITSGEGDVFAGVQGLAEGASPIVKYLNNTSQLLGGPSVDLGYGVKPISELKPGESAWEHAFNQLVYGKGGNTGLLSMVPPAGQVKKAYRFGAGLIQDTVGVDVPAVERGEWKIEVYKMLGLPVSSVDAEKLETSAYFLEQERRAELDAYLDDLYGPVDEEAGQTKAGRRRAYAELTGNVADPGERPEGLTDTEWAALKRARMFGLE